MSRFGAGFDTVNTEDARRFGVWVANSPDYGVGEVATGNMATAVPPPDPVPSPPTPARKVKDSSSASMNPNSV